MKKHRDTDSGKVCIIGAGCSGFTTARCLQREGIAYDQFEMSDDIGGNWYHDNPNGLSACYESLHIDTSKFRLAFDEYPVPQSWPDFPHHSELLQYFKDYVDHFGLRDGITFNTAVEEARREEDGFWRVRLSNGKSFRYRALIVANGHHWDARIPDEYPGTELFAGIQMHSHDYRSPFRPHDLRGRRVLVVGVGNSAMDIASEVSQRSVAEQLFVSTRRGVWVLPKYINGRPADKIGKPGWMPGALARWLAARMIQKSVGRMEDYGLPKPDHQLLTAHPSVSGEFLTRLGCGDIRIRPGIRELHEDGVSFLDGSKEKIDVVIWATGYRISFPFLTQKELAVKGNRFALYHRMIKPGWRNLFFMGLAQSLPTLVNLAEKQAIYVAAVLSGRHQMPDDSSMQAIMERDEKRDLAHYYDSERHTIQVDFVDYVQRLKKELKKNWRQIQPA